MKFLPGSGDFFLLSLMHSSARPSSMPKTSWNCWSMVPLQEKSTWSHVLTFFSVWLVKTQSSRLDYIHDIHFYGNINQYTGEKKFQYNFVWLLSLKKMVFSASEKELVVEFLSLIYTLPSLHVVPVCKRRKCCRYLPLAYSYVRCVTAGWFLSDL